MHVVIRSVHPHSLETCEGSLKAKAMFISAGARALALVAFFPARGVYQASTSHPMLHLSVTMCH